jgi:magnesium-transporting ATPase (P-type)
MRPAANADAPPGRQALGGQTPPPPELEPAPGPDPPPELGAAPDPEERVALLLRDLRASRRGLSSREAQRRLQQYGPNALRRRGGTRWPRELARQLTHPLALLLWAAALLAWLAGIQAVAAAIVVVIAINAVFAFVQETQAERAVEALAQFLPARARVLRDGAEHTIPARELVPGDVIAIEEGESISADARLLDGTLEVDMSMLTGESAPVVRSAQTLDTRVPLLQARELVLSGTACTEGDALALVFATGMHTEIGRIAALSERVTAEESPLEQQVRRVAWLIAAIAVALGIAFLPIAMLGAGLPFKDAVVFAVGLLVGNVPEGLLPVITLALAVGVRELVRKGAVVKRLSAVETLGSTDVICTDKTGTLTENRMQVTRLWTLGGAFELTTPAAGSAPVPAESSLSVPAEPSTPVLAESSRSVPAASSAPVAAEPSVPGIAELARAMAVCNNASLDADGEATGDPTEVALMLAAQRLGCALDARERLRRRRGELRFDPTLKLMSTLEERDGAVWIHTKGAPEAVLPRCATALVAEPAPAAAASGEEGRGEKEKKPQAVQASTLRPPLFAAERHERVPAVVEQPLAPEQRERVAALVEAYARDGLRVLALARRRLADGEPLPTEREQAERDLCFLGLAAMIDPPRPQVAQAVADCHAAGIRVIVITGDHGLTAAAVARQVGIGGQPPRIVGGSELERMDDASLEALLREGEELIFARSSPESKLRIADALRAEGHVVAMTGDGVNDAPALRRADIGVAMGRSGTDVAREASTMVLSDDNFATIAIAVEAGRRVYDNIRKFILYIFAHATPEVAPFLVYALGGGAIPLPLTVLQLLAFDVGTETLPALALGREPAEPGLMTRAPRRRSESVIQPPMLLRAWLFLGLIAAVLEMGGFFYVLTKAGWSPGDPTGAGTPLHHAYLQATTMTFFSMVACQIGTAFAARTDRASLRSVGVFSNPLLLVGIAFELILAAAIMYLPPLQSLLATAPIPPEALALTVAFPFVVWGADEARRWWLRRSSQPDPVAGSTAMDR